MVKIYDGVFLSQRVESQIRVSFLHLRNSLICCNFARFSKDRGVGRAGGGGGARAPHPPNILKIIKI